MNNLNLFQALHLSLITTRLIGSIAALLLMGCLVSLSLFKLPRRQAWLIIGLPVTLLAIVFALAVLSVQRSVR